MSCITEDDKQKGQEGKDGEHERRGDTARRYEQASSPRLRVFASLSSFILPSMALILRGNELIATTAL
ncbi:MAG TPA: hypothetical protein VM866_12145, partial [Pyrinomonadaceae bacterium]|nr:hypothetical protein [Pyrinomonadaceae bacterium]